MWQKQFEKTPVFSLRVNFYFFTLHWFYFVTTETNLDEQSNKKQKLQQDGQNKKNPGITTVHLMCCYLSNFLHTGYSSLLFLYFKTTVCNFLYSHETKRNLYGFSLIKIFKSQLHLICSTCFMIKKLIFAYCFFFLIINYHKLQQSHKNQQNKC